MIYDIVGTIYKPTGIMLTDNEGNEYPEMGFISDENSNPLYHVNALDVEKTYLEDETLNPQCEYAKIEPFIVEVNSPSRMFAGRNDTICLKFNSREEWLALGIETEETE